MQVRKNSTRRKVIGNAIAAVALCCGAAACSPDAQTAAADPRIDSLFAKWDKPDSPGCAVGVLRDGQFVYEHGYGMANLDYDIPNSPRMVYYIASDSKQFTAAAIGLLVLDGKLSLDDDIRKYLPEVPDYSKLYGVPITVSDLVHHTSGLRDIFTLMGLAGIRAENVMTDDSSMALIARQKEHNFKPCTEYLYSNTGYQFLSLIVERVSGKPLRAFADERIFQPLGMTHTHFHDDAGHIVKNRAMSYVPDSAIGFRLSYLQNFDKTGDGGLYTTVEDLAKWDGNYYTYQVGGDELQKLIHTRGVLANGDTLTYAFGNNVSTYRGLPIEEHGGSLMGYKANFLRFPDQKFSVIETCNLGSINPGPIARRIAELYLGDQMGPEEKEPAQRERSTRATVTLSAADLGRLAGIYYSEELGATYGVLVKDGGLVLRRPNSPDTRTTVEDRSTLRASGGGASSPVTLRFDGGAGAARSFTAQTGRVKNIRFVRR
jgi:CubicO group peptidase (beta-lactamase class C family)